MSDEERRDGLSGPVRPRRPHDFDTLYTGTPSMGHRSTAPAFLELAEAV